MSRKGQLAFLGVMLGFMFFITIVVLIEPVKDGIGIARTDLACGSGGLSTMTQMVCILTDAYLFMFVGGGFSVAIGLLGMKKAGIIGQG